MLSNSNLDKIKKMTKKDWQELMQFLKNSNIKCLDQNCTDLELAWFFLHGYFATTNTFIEKEIPENTEDSAPREEKQDCLNLLLDAQQMRQHFKILWQYIQEHIQEHMKKETGNPYKVEL